MSNLCFIKILIFSPTVLIYMFLCKRVFTIGDYTVILFLKTNKCFDITCFDIITFV